MSERAFVAGATGYVGREVVRDLRDRGIETTAHIRPQSRSVERWRASFAAMGATVDETPWELDAITATIARLEPTLVFALLGTTRKRAKAESIDNPYEAIDYGLTAMLFSAAATLANPAPRFIYLSAAGVSERSSSAYMAARWRAESLISAGPLPYVLARPAIITGADRDDARPGERLAGGVADAALSVLGAFGARGLRDRYRSTTNVTLAAALVRWALDPEAKAKIAEGADLRGR